MDHLITKNVVCKCYILPIYVLVLCLLLWKIIMVACYCNVLLDVKVIQAFFWVLEFIWTKFKFEPYLLLEDCSFCILVPSILESHTFWWMDILFCRYWTLQYFMTCAVKKYISWHETKLTVRGVSWTIRIFFFWCSMLSAIDPNG